jgi:hypothetical protein
MDREKNNKKKKKNFPFSADPSVLFVARQPPDVYFLSSQSVSRSYIIRVVAGGGLDDPK